MGDYSRFLDEEFPQYLAMGMSPEDYWTGPPEWVLHYIRAAELRRQRWSDEAWLMGAYVFQAVSTVAYNLHRDKKKGQKTKEYMEEPIRVIPYTEAEEKARAEKERQRVIAFFDRMAENDRKQRKGSDANGS